jgi:hypothetical protein
MIVLSQAYFTEAHLYFMGLSSLDLDWSMKTSVLEKKMGFLISVVKVAEREIDGTSFQDVAKILDRLPYRV